MAKKTTEKKRNYTSVKRAGYIGLFSGSLATAVYLSILVASPDFGQYVLAGFNYISATYFFNQAIK